MQMKRILLTLLCAAVLAPIWAQDIIITTASERIDAQILEVSKNEIKYKRMDNLEGPTFVIATSELASIIYKNGNVQTFQQEEQKPQPTTYQPTGQGTVTLLEGDRAPAYQPGVTIRKDDDDYYWLGNLRMQEEVYYEYIKNNCQEAWDSYQTGRKLFRTGWGLFGGGTALFIAGIALASAGNWGVYTVTYTYNKSTGQVYNSTSSWSREKEDCFTAGAVLLSFGSAALSASVPLLIIGSIKKNNSHEVYNESCAKQQAPLSLNFQMGTNGVGLALKF